MLLGLLDPGVLCSLELGDGLLDFIGLDDELKRSGDSISVKQENTVMLYEKGI